MIDLRKEPKDTRRWHVLAAADDLMGSFLYYDRKESEDLPRNGIEDAIIANEVTIEELVGHFRGHLEKAVMYRIKS